VPKLSKRLIEKTARDFASALEARFPGIEHQIMDHGIGGYDAWVRVMVPLSLRSSILDIQGATAELNEQFWDATGVAVIATVIDKGSVLEASRAKGKADE
jgi:hypothetical protein